MKRSDNYRYLLMKNTYLNYFNYLYFLNFVREANLKSQGNEH
jgi:hypothetical protein